MPSELGWVTVVVTLINGVVLVINTYLTLTLRRRQPREPSPDDESDNLV